MVTKRCCVKKCKSSSSRTEDIGVTFHKFPKNDKVRQSWLDATQHKLTKETRAYVCSRHFRKNDFQIYQDSKYMLKSDSVPSIFTGNMSDLLNSKMETDRCKGEDIMNNLCSSKDTEENIDAIKEFLDQQEKEIERQKQISGIVQYSSVSTVNIAPRSTELSTEIDVIHEEQPIAITDSVLNMILSETDDKIKCDKSKSKQSLCTGDSMALSVGSKVDAKDYGEMWYPAEILEIDCDEMEVLVHYNTKQYKPDEWISVNSSRLRPTRLELHASEAADERTSVESTAIVVEDMPEEINRKPTFVVGERCLARWRDNRRFLATITNELGNGTFEVVFDDGFQWKCPTSRMYKVKDSDRAMDNFSVETIASSTPTPIQRGLGPSFVESPSAKYPNPFHTHLFDPTRDYLGSKTERREMKRKLNIKEIFNIGTKKRKKVGSPKEKSIRVVKERKQKPGWRRKTEQEHSAVKTEVPEAVASIIGTLEDDPQETVEEVGQKPTERDALTDDSYVESINERDKNGVKEKEPMMTSPLDSDNSDMLATNNNRAQEPASEDEVKLENFEKPDEVKHEEVIDRIKEVISKLEGKYNGNQNEEPKIEVKEEPVVEKLIKEDPLFDTSKELILETNVEKPKKKMSKLNKSKKLRLLQEKKVKKQVEKVKSELEEMKRQFEEMRQAMLKKTEELASQPKNQEMPESFLLPGEWCCKWVNGQPVGTVSELDSEMRFDANNKPVLPRRSVQVEDKRLPEGWTKHMVRRSFGLSAGKWDVVIVGPDNKRFHTKTDMRNYLETSQDESLKAYEGALMDFGVHLKLARRMGWYKSTGEEVLSPPGFVSNISPLVKRKNHSKRKAERKEKKKRLKLSSMYLQDMVESNDNLLFDSTELVNEPLIDETLPPEDGYVYVGSLKVQIIDNLLRCPAEGCLKNFRNNTLMKMHIKHYHRELRKMLGATPKVEDLAYARARPTGREMKKVRRGFKVKLPKLPRRHDDAKPKPEALDPIPTVYSTDSPVRFKPERLIPRSQDSPKLRQVLAATKTGKRPKVLLPVVRTSEELAQREHSGVIPRLESNIIPLKLDFEAAISTHTVTRPTEEFKVKGDRGRPTKQASEDDEWLGGNSDVDTRSSCPGSGTPDRYERTAVNQSALETNDDDKDEEDMYMYNEYGERVKIVQMKREEIINCHCGYREEDGLMVQCELCLCWQHATCHNIQRASEVPEKYTCSICLNPKRGRRSQRFLHDQDRLYEGQLPGSKPCETLRRSHELSGNLLRIQDALHALRVKYHVATKKNHPKLYLWAKDWEKAELSMTQEKLNSDYSDLNIIINSMSKDRMPVKPVDIRDLDLDLKTSPDDDDEQDTLSLSGLPSPAGAALDLPITTSDLDRFTQSVQEQESACEAATGPQPEEAIDSDACRERLLRHLHRCQTLVDARLDSIEAQVAELESQDPSFADDETAEYCPRTKQTIQMLLRDLGTMEELGAMT